MCCGLIVCHPRGGSSRPCVHFSFDHRAVESWQLGKASIGKEPSSSFVFSVLTLLICFSFIALGDHFGESLAV